ncbi:MAG: GAF domain-containing sensor histidine kinase [Paludisphaera borealis]|uniref:GAF domain-containing sensor histidine kinase n=1 Tax=Paludisphaera borealis TaxID=1387353 RepID=UPI0028507785|nr:GAF domain-containing sensor histidine kinase [Paludisphaera borealis]MDR3620621.1 GAF domain-containing sensor histidine kinase [Paludisphaera borealis]
MRETISDDISAVGRIEAVTRILEVICRTTGLGFSAVARVTESQWIACAVRDEIEFGLQPGGELVLDTTICDEIRQSGELVVIEDAETDERYNRHPTPKQYGFRSYISVPIRLPDGRFFGTLCAIDPRPAQLKKPETVEMFKLFASLIAFHLEAQLRLISSERALLDEREASQLREQFIAVLGHDLRNPLAAIRSGAFLLTRLPKGEQADGVRGMIDRSVVRMTELIDNVLDFARGRLGDGLSLDRKNDEELDGVLDHVVNELEAAWPERVVHREIRIGRPIFCNSARLAQMLSNLIGNALAHGDPTSPIRVRAQTSPDALEVSVANLGPTIPPETIERLFQPFFRGSAKTGKQGLGLGLHIAAEIARAHRARLEVVSSAGETCFTFRMPLEEE